MMALVSAGGENARRRAHGPVGRGAGVRVRHRRLSRNAGERYRALSAASPALVLCRGICIRGRLVRGRGSAWRSGFIARRQAACRARRRWPISAPCGCRRSSMMTDSETFDVVVVGGGPSGATAAHDLASAGTEGAAARPRRAHQAVRRRHSAAADPRFRYSRSSAGRAGQFRAHGVAVGQAGRYADRRRLCRHGRSRGVRRMAARARRRRPAPSGGPDCSSASSATPTAQRSCIMRSAPRDGAVTRKGRPRSRADRCRRRLVGCGAAEPARRRRLPYVFAYHEIVRSPTAANPISTARVATSTTAAPFRRISTAGCFRMATPSASAPARPTRGSRCATPSARLRDAAGLGAARPSAAKARRSRCIRCRDGTTATASLLAGDAAGVVAPASGEGIYYAMIGGRLAAEAVDEFLETGDVEGAANGAKALHADAWHGVLDPRHDAVVLVFQ